MKYYSVVFTGIMSKGEYVDTERYVKACVCLEDDEPVTKAVSQLEQDIPLNEIFLPGYSHAVTEKTKEGIIEEYPEIAEHIS